LGIRYPDQRGGGKKEIAWMQSHETAGRYRGPVQAKMDPRRTQGTEGGDTYGKDYKGRDRWLGRVLLSGESGQTSDWPEDILIRAQKDVRVRTNVSPAGKGLDLHSRKKQGRKKSGITGLGRVHDGSGWQSTDGGADGINDVGGQKVASRTAHIGRRWGSDPKISMRCTGAAAESGRREVANASKDV